jgi:hypothetical protein
MRPLARAVKGVSADLPRNLEKNFTHRTPVIGG